MNTKNIFCEIIIVFTIIIIIQYAIAFIFKNAIYIFIATIIYIGVLAEKYKIENMSLHHIITKLNHPHKGKVFNNCIQIHNINIINEKKQVEMKKNICVVCNIYCKRKCQKCKTAYYCCVEHQMKDWKCHKKICK
jgi:hypothetical protein